MVEVDKSFASKGVAGAGLGLGIAGTALGLMGNGALPGLFGGWGNCNNVCNENMPVTRYELAQESKIADLQSQIALRDATPTTTRRRWRCTSTSTVSFVTSGTLCAPRL